MRIREFVQPVMIRATERMSVSGNVLLLDGENIVCMARMSKRVVNISLTIRGPFVGLLHFN